MVSWFILSKVSFAEHLKSLMSKAGSTRSTGHKQKRGLWVCSMS